MDFFSVHVIKIEIGSITGLSDDTLHIYVGLIILLTSAAVLRKPLWSFVPLLVVITVAIIGEIIDLRSDLIHLGYWRWKDSILDLVHSISSPAMLLFFFRYSVTPYSKYPPVKQGKAPFCLLWERRHGKENHNYFFPLLYERRHWEKDHNYS